MAEVDVSQLDEVHDLYRIDPAEFVEARAALVKQLRADKRVDEARAVVKLRKPSAPSWALDQVAHDEPELIAAALAAGEALQAATTETLEGDASNLRAATDAEGKASAAVIEAAGAHLPLTADLRERMGATLRAAIADEAVRALLVAGLLAADHEPPPMGFAAPSELAAEHETKPAKKPRTEPGVAKAQLAAAPEAPARSNRKVRRVGTPGSAKRVPVDEVDAKRKAKEVERLQAEEVERRRAEAEAEKERKKQQAALDAAAKKARTAADRLDEKAKKAEDAARVAAESAAAARTEADAALAEAAEAEAAAAAGAPGTGSGADPVPSGPTSRSRSRSGSGPAIRKRPKAPGRR